MSRDAHSQGGGRVTQVCVESRNPHNILVVVWRVGNPGVSGREVFGISGVAK
jgi:hypothetical protein